MSGGGGDDSPAPGVSSPEDLQRAADSGTPLSTQQIQANTDFGRDTYSVPTQTDFFGQNYSVPTAINSSIPSFSVGDSGSFSPSDSGGGGFSSGITPGSLGGSIGGGSSAGPVSDLAGSPAPAPQSFGDVQSFGGSSPSFSGSSDNLSSPSITNLASAAAGGSDQPISGFSSPSGGAGNLTSFSGFGATPGGDFPDPTSTASAANSGGVPDTTQPYDPFNNTVQGKDQGQLPQGIPGLPPGAANANASAQPSDIASLAAGASNPSLAPGASGIPNYSGSGAGAPITDLAAASGKDESGNPSNGLYGSNPFTPYGTTNPAYGDNTATGTPEAYPGQSSVSNQPGSSGSSSSSSGSGGKSALSQLADSFTIPKALGALIAGGAGLYSVAQGNSSSKAGIANLQSSIPQIQSVIGQVQTQAAQLASEAASLKSQGSSIINSTSPISDQAKQLMSYVSNGQLPPGYQTQVDQGIKAAKAAAISNAAAHGQNVIPGPDGTYSQNSVLQQQLDSIDRQGITLSQTLAKSLYDAGVSGIGAANQTIGAGTSIVQAGNSDQANADALTQTGLNGINLQNNTYAQILAAQKAQAALTGQAISNFASALGGGGTTIKIGGNGAPA